LTTLPRAAGLEGVFNLPLVDIEQAAETARVFPAEERKPAVDDLGVQSEHLEDELTTTMRGEPASLKSTSIPRQAEVAVLVGTEGNPFLERIAQSCDKLGMRTVIVDHSQLGRYFSITTTAAGTTLSPYCSLYIDARSSSVEGATASEALKVRQQDALLWAIAAWTTAPMINQPRLGGQGLWRGTELRRGTELSVFLAHDGQPSSAAESVAVAVVRQHAWAILQSGTPDPDRNATTTSALERRSIELVTDLRLDLGVVYWADDGGSPVPVAVDTYPTASMLGPVLPAVANALAVILHGG
jgi:hypothetical protein